MSTHKLSHTSYSPHGYRCQHPLAQGFESSVNNLLGIMPEPCLLRLAGDYIMMLPKRPPRSGRDGFLYLPPYRVQGISVAGEQTAIHVPELDVAFDVGLCPKTVLTAPFVAEN